MAPDAGVANAGLENIWTQIDDTNDQKTGIELAEIKVNGKEVIETQIKEVPGTETQINGAQEKGAEETDVPVVGAEVARAGVEGRALTVLRVRPTSAGNSRSRDLKANNRKFVIQELDEEPEGKSDQ